MSNIGHNGGDINEADTSNSFFVSREVFDHPAFQAKPWCDGFAWLHLLSMASVETRRKLNKGTIVIIDPGDVMEAHGELAKRWGWTVDKVRYFLKRLEREAMITRFCAKQDNNRSTNQIQIITICNFKKYQLIQETLHQANYQAEHQARTRQAPGAHQARTNTIDNNLDRTNNTSPLTPQGGNEPSVVFEDGKLTVLNGTSASLAEEFPGIDLQAVCNRAAKDVIQLKTPSPNDVLAIIRSHAQTELEAAQRRAKRSAANSGTRLPNDWQLTRALGEWALETYRITDVEVRKEAEAFRNYFLAAPGAKGKKLDWSLTWKNWIGRKYLLKTETPKASDRKSPQFGPAAFDYEADARLRENALNETRERMQADRERMLRMSEEQN
jgi:hypothetical protein